MAHWGAIPGVIGRIHKRYSTPSVSHAWNGRGPLIAVTVALLLISGNVLRRLPLIALGFRICFYYGFNGIVCAVYYRHELFKSSAQLPALASRRSPVR